MNRVDFDFVHDTEGAFTKDLVSWYPLNRHDDVRADVVVIYTIFGCREVVSKEACLLLQKITDTIRIAE